MAKTRKTYVEFSFPGIFFSEYEVRQVRNRDVEKLEVPNGAFGFRFFDIVETKTVVDGRKRTLKSNRIKVSAMHYCGGRVMTLAEVKKEMPTARILISNMEGNGWNKIIKCRTGNFQPFEKGDIYVKVA